MKVRELKQFIDGLTEDQLDQDLLYNSKEFSISGEVPEISISKENLYWDGEDDPSTLYTESELKNLEDEDEDISDFEIEIPKGSIVIRIGEH